MMLSATVFLATMRNRPAATRVLLLGLFVRPLMKRARVQRLHQVFQISELPNIRPEIGQMRDFWEWRSRVLTFHALGGVWDWMVSLIT